MTRLNILGIDIDIVDMESALAKVGGFLHEMNGSRLIFTANPHSLVVARKDRMFKDALASADLVIPDGMLLVAASRMFYPRSKFPERVSGPDLFLEVCKIANEKSLGYFFYGSTKEVLKKIEERMRNEFPNIRIVGSYAPPFRELSNAENEQIVRRINEAAPDILWVGLTAPKQEKWIFQNENKLNVGIIGAIGAAFDFYAGTKKRSSRWFRQRGLEWLPRLIREPGRMWRRTFVSAPMFLYFVMREKLSRIFR